MTTTLEQLLEEIAFRRRKDLRTKQSGNTAALLYTANQNTTYWTDLFVRHFLFQTDYEVDRDDLLFFIRKGPNHRNAAKPQVDVSPSLTDVATTIESTMRLGFLTTVICFPRDDGT